MPMEKTKTITLRNVALLETEDQAIKKDVSVTAPCVQANAAGNMGVSEDLESFRKSAWASGQRFRLALTKN